MQPVGPDQADQAALRRRGEVEPEDRKGGRHN